MRRCYGLAKISRLLKIIGLFYKRALKKRLYSTKETCNLKEPTNRSHPICACSTSQSHCITLYQMSRDGTDIVFIEIVIIDIVSYDIVVSLRIRCQEIYDSVTDIVFIDIVINGIVSYDIVLSLCIGCRGTYDIVSDVVFMTL